YDGDAFSLKPPSPFSEPPPMPPLDGWDLKQYRACLKKRAADLLGDKRVRIRFDESDLVQETLQRAAQKADTYRGGDQDPERLAWLEKIQDNLVIDLHRAHHADKRDLDRERDLREALRQSSLC